MERFFPLCQEEILGFPVGVTDPWERGNVTMSSLTRSCLVLKVVAARVADGRRAEADYFGRFFTSKPVTLPFYPMNDLGFLDFNLVLFFLPGLKIQDQWQRQIIS